MMFGISPICPAYGRDYKNLKDLEADFNADKDFITPAGQYINKSQIIQEGMTSIQVRYAKKKKTTMIEVS